GQTDRNKAMSILSSYLDAETYLQDAGLLEEGVKAIEAKTGVNILRLSDLSPSNSIGGKKNG
ncbi:hypothetical protein, partial [Photobacterium damselae]